MVSAHGRLQAAVISSIPIVVYSCAPADFTRVTKALLLTTTVLLKGKKKKKEKLKFYKTLNCQDTAVIWAMTNNNINFPVLLLLAVMRINSDHVGFGRECKQGKSCLKWDTSISLLFLFQFSLHRHREIILKSSFNYYYFGPFHNTFWSINLIILFLLLCHPFEAM